MVVNTPLNTSQNTSSQKCYDLKSLERDNKATLVLSNTRELDRVPSTE